MEYPFPTRFETIEVAAFFDFKLLLAEILDKDGLDSEGIDRALYWAARKSSLDPLTVLLQHGANPTRIGIDRQTPLTISAQHGHLSAVQILLKQPGTDIKLKGISGTSALPFAAGNGHQDIVEELMNHGDTAPVTTITNTGHRSFGPCMQTMKASCNRC
jgi:ankyrin repeat protein